MEISPQMSSPSIRYNRRRLFGLCIATVCIAGCTAPWVKKEEENKLLSKTKEVEKIINSQDRPRLLSNAGSIIGLDPQQFEAFGLVIDLPGTGGDTRPGASRDYILQDLRVREVKNPNALLSSRTTAIVKLKANCPPGVVQGDPIDVIVQKSMDSEAENLRNGNLMNARLMDFVSLGGKVRQSELKAHAGGPVVTVPASLNSTKELDKELGIILGGAKVANTQKVYLRVNDELQHVATSRACTEAINARFDVYDKTSRKGIAEAKSDRSVELTIPVKYRQDLRHFADVLLSIGFAESKGTRSIRMDQCKKDINLPNKARSCASQLEAIGKDGIPALKEAMNNPDLEVKFFAAYSLAYLDQTDAIPVLVDLAIAEPAFRPQALIGLSVIENPSADEALRLLMHEKEPELCYGALRIMRKRSSNDSIAQGQMLEGIGRITEVASSYPLVAVSLTAEPEIATFGGPIAVNLSDFYEVSPRMTMKSENGSIRLASFEPGREDLFATAEPNLRSVLLAMREVRATYSDAIIFLDHAEQAGWINAPVEFNPIPVAGRKYERKTTADAAVKTATNYSWWDPRNLLK